MKSYAALNTTFKYQQMTLMNKRIMIQDLIDRTELLQEAVQKFFRLDEEEINFRPTAGKWSIAEIFDHLNITHEIYIKNIFDRIDEAPASDDQDYHSGWLGDWVYEKILPRQDGTVYKFKTPKMLQPQQGVLDGHSVLKRFLRQINDIQHILENSYNLNLEKTRIPFPFSRLISLRLGDSFRFMIAHCERHLLQANKVRDQLQNRKAIAV
jgi:hypothetical protein